MTPQVLEHYAQHAKAVGNRAQRGALFSVVGGNRPLADAQAQRAGAGDHRRLRMTETPTTATPSTARRIRPVRKLVGVVSIPGDKSISHRALMLAAAATGTSRIQNLATGADVQSTRRVLGELSQIKKQVVKGLISFGRAYVREGLLDWFRLHAVTMDSALAAHWKYHEG